MRINDADAIYLGGLADAVYMGSELVWSAYRESTDVYVIAGSQSVVIPSWAKWARVVVLGGGGGGSGGDTALNRNGKGGKAGRWNSGTLDLSGAPEMEIVVGAGGAAGPKNEVGTAGGASSVGVGSLMVSGAGGAAGVHASISGDTWGESPGNYTAFGQTFVGGGQANMNAAANPPGGGGGGGSGGFFGSGNAGNAGARGQVWVFLYSSL